MRGALKLTKSSFCKISLEYLTNRIYTSIPYGKLEELWGDRSAKAGNWKNYGETGVQKQNSISYLSENKMVRQLS
jgi:hypothetical protein